MTEEEGNLHRDLARERKAAMLALARQALHLPAAEVRVFDGNQKVMVARLAGQNIASQVVWDRVVELLEQIEQLLTRERV